MQRRTLLLAATGFGLAALSACGATPIERPRAPEQVIEADLAPPSTPPASRAVSAPEVAPEPVAEVPDEPTIEVRSLDVTTEPRETTSYMLKRVRFRGYRARLARLAGVGSRRGRRRATSMSSPPTIGLGAASALGSTGATTSENITNNQVAGVAEGGIVQNLGEYLIVLRRGRLFSIHVGADGSLTPRSVVDVSPPPRRPRRPPWVDDEEWAEMQEVLAYADEDNAWYDEILVHPSSRRIVLVGYSYELEATELSLFRMRRDGRLVYEDTAHLKSSDYYSGTNYASRLLGNRLVLYVPVSVIDESYGRVGQLSFRGRGAWRDLAASARVFQANGRRDHTMLHALVTCDLRTGFSCRASGVLGGLSTQFYISSDALYIHTEEDRSEYAIDAHYERDEEADDLPMYPSTLYRLSLDGRHAGAVSVTGSPLNQFSFHDDGGSLRVLLDDDDSRDEGPVLVEYPLSVFANGTGDVVGCALPGEVAQNRFMSHHLLYGAGDALVVHEYASGATTQLTLTHAMGRIEPLGEGALVAGTGVDGVQFTSVDLAPAVPEVAGTFSQPSQTAQETRSHGFFFRADTGRSGIFGLAGVGDESGLVSFGKVEDLTLSSLGALRSRRASGEDHCVVSCTDWYGNTRPIFLGDRIFALLGYELVEGRLSAGEVTSVQRVDFSTLIEAPSGAASESLATPF